MSLRPGVYPDISMADYISDPAPKPSVSTGVIKALIERSPAHAHAEHPRLGGAGDDASARSDLGSAAHAKLLGGADAVAIVDADDWRTKAAKEARDTARAQGKIPVLAEMAKRLDNLVLAATRTLEDAGLPLSDARVEHTLIWQDDGAWCRSRPDMIYDARRLIVDFKTAENADPATWIRTTLTKGGYHLQGVHGLCGLDVLEGGPDRDFVFLVGELAPPHACSLIGIDPALLDLARQQRAQALAMWRQCLRINKWPGYRQDIHWAGVPSYLEWDWEARKQEAV